MNKKQKKMLIRIAVTIILLIALHFIAPSNLWRFFAYLIPYFIIGYDILKKALRGIINRLPFDESLLMALATLGAFLLALYRQFQGNTGDYTEAVAVMLFYQIGEFFQNIAVNKSRKNIADLMDIRPDYANLESSGKIIKVNPNDVETGSIIHVYAGEKIPIDGVITDGSSNLNTIALTGESAPIFVQKDDEVLSGAINIDGVLKIKTTKNFSNSTASKILELVENASSKKSKSENFISKFARIYTPIVVYMALILAIVPPIIAGGDFSCWLYRALTFLVISCPCALVVSIPLTFFAGIGKASRDGILIKGSNYLETLSKIKTIVFDKTGTLTQGEFKVNAIHHSKIDEDKLLEYAVLAECSSNHPIAMSLKNALKCDIDNNRANIIKEIGGNGIIATIDDKEIIIGSEKIMEKYEIKPIICHSVGTIVHIAINREYIGHIVISDVIKKNSPQAIEKLKKLGIKIIMLTGDLEKVARAVADELKIDEYYFGLLPSDKVEKVEEFIRDKNTLAFAGDGINDAPVLSRADIGIAMGALGSDSAIEASDVVLMDDNPEKIIDALKISKKCLNIVKQNIFFALFVKFLCLVLGALGIANMWIAVFADVGVMILCILNAFRMFFK